jgi:hypothetical protein
MDAVAGPRTLRLHAPPDPHFFLRELLIELRALHLLGLNHERLSFYNNGINRRLTDVHGHLLKEIIA